MDKQRVKFPEVLFFQEGPGVRNTQYTNEGVKLLNVANLVDGSIDLSTSDRYISTNEAFGKYKHFLCDEGDFIVASSGIKVEYIDKKMGFVTKEMLPLCMNTSTIRFKPLDKNILNIRYFMYFLKSNDFKQQLSRHITGSAQLNYGPSHLKIMTMPLVSIEKQVAIVNKLDKTVKLLQIRNKQLQKFDNLIKARFVEMFGDPIRNSKNLPTDKISERYFLKAGITTSADEIHDYSEVYKTPCFGGNGVRGYVKSSTYSGEYPIIGRQGALCGNIQFATGNFHATEHAVLVTILQNDNVLWVYYLLKFMDLNRFHTGAAQPGLSVKTLNTVDIITVDRKQQDEFASFAKQVDKSKVVNIFCVHRI